MAKLIKNLMLLGTAAFFAVMWALLLGEHIEQQRSAELTVNYERLLPPGQQRRETDLGIYFMGRRLGKTHTEVKRLEQGTIQVRSRTQIELGKRLEHVIGASGKININFTASFEALSGLRHFALSCEELGVKLRGIRRDGELVLVGSFHEQRIQTTASLEGGRFVTGAFSPVSGFPELDKNAVGKTWQFHVANPVLGRVEKVTAKVESSTMVSLNSELVRVFRISVSGPVSRWESWVTADGEILVQGTPYGLTLRREDIPQSVMQQLLQQGARASGESTSGSAAARRQ